MSGGWPVLGDGVRLGDVVSSAPTWSCTQDCNRRRCSSAIMPCSGASVPRPLQRGGEVGALEDLRRVLCRTGAVRVLPVRASASRRSWGSVVRRERALIGAGSVIGRGSVVDTMSFSGNSCRLQSGVYLTALRSSGTTSSSAPGDDVQTTTLLPARPQSRFAVGDPAGAPAQIRRCRRAGPGNRGLARGHSSRQAPA